MVELLYNGNVEGVFSTEELADEFAKLKSWGTYSVQPLGTFLFTDVHLNDFN